MKTTIRVTLVLGALSLLAPRAQAQYFGRNAVQYENFHFKVLKTQHFDVYFYDKEAASAAEAARMAERWYTRISAILRHQLAHGAPRKRVGILPDGRAPARDHTEIMVGERRIGEITSGGFGPTVGGPIAMGYVAAADAAPGTALSLVVRGTPRPARIVKLPFVASQMDALCRQLSFPAGRAPPGKTAASNPPA